MRYNLLLQILAFGLLVTMLYVTPALTQWSADPNVNTAISTLQRAEFPVLVSDGAGGAIIAWHDLRNGPDWDIYAQRISADGVIKWTVGGIAIAETSGDQMYPSIVSDSSGGAIIAWEDQRGGNWEVFAQRIDSSGAIQWETNGVPVARGAYDHVHPEAAGDGSGGVIITWQDWRNGGTNSDVYAQRLDKNGVRQWIAGTDSAGFPVSMASNDQLYPNIASDGAGGAIVTWEDQRGVSGNDIYAQRINHNGIRQWVVAGDSDGFGISTAARDQNNPVIISDGSGGAIIAWEDSRDIDYGLNIFADRIDGSGASLWYAGGLPICTDTLDQDSPTLTSDLAGGAIITWEDYRTNDTSDIYAQHVDATGHGKWTGGGTPICTAANYQQYPVIAGDGQGGAIIAWQDYRSDANHDIYAQQIDASGATQWTGDGNPVSTATNDQEIPYVFQANPCMISDGSGNVILAWHDYRNGGICNIYASKIFADGALPIQMSSFAATVNASAQVVLNWSTVSEVNNYGFDVQRKTTGGQFKDLENSFIPGHGTTLDPQKYSFTDKTVTPGLWYYRLKQTDLSGKEAYSSAIKVTVGVLGVNGTKLPTEYQLEQNYPNPFNPGTMIKYQLPKEGHVTLRVYNSLGEVVATLVNGEQEPGFKSVTFDASRLSSGMYYYRLQAGNFIETKKLLLLK